MVSLTIISQDYLKQSVFLVWLCVIHMVSIDTIFASVQNFSSCSHNLSFGHFFFFFRLGFSQGTWHNKEVCLLSIDEVYHKGA